MRTLPRRPVACLAALLTALLLHAAAATAGPHLVASPDRLAFSTDGGARVVMLHNRGDAPLQLRGLAFTADAAGFSAPPLMPRVLLPGQALPVTVTYVRSGARPQAFGALLIYSDDPDGFDDPRSEERDSARGVALSAGETRATLWLWLPPLLAAGLLGLGRRSGLRVLTRPLEWLGTLPPLLASLWLLSRFDPGFGVPDGNYGMQLGLHRALWPARGIEIFTGLDGLSLPLALLLSAAALLRLLVRRTTDEAPAAWLLLHAGGLLALCALDAGWLLLGWELLLLGACARLRVWLRACRGPAGRWGYVLSTQLGTVLLLGSLWQLWAHSLPTALANGTTVAHSTDLVKLAYLNYFGDLKWAGLRLDRLLWAALTIGTLLPVVLLPLLPAPRIERLWLSLPLLALATATTVRLPFMLLPQATAALGPWLVGLAVAWTVAWTLRALRTAALPQLLSAALTARAGGVFVGLLAMTQTGVHAALLQLWHHGLVVALLALLVPASERRPAYRAGLWGALVLAIDVPGTLGFVQRTLLLLGAFAWSRLAAVVLTVAGLPVAIAALRLHVRRRAARRAPARPRIGREPPTLELAAVVGLAGLATVLGLWTQPLLDLWRGFANDFLSHVCAHLDAGALALLAP